MAEVRRPVYRGSQMVRALWFDTALLGEAQARRRLLDQWDLGARAWRLHGGYLLEWPRARRLQCERAPGLPFCDQDGILVSAPLLAQERAGIAPGTAVLVLGASVHAQALDTALRVDPSEWLDLSGVTLCVASAMPALPLDGFVQSVPAPAPDVRALLGDAVPPPSARRADFLRQVQQGQQGRRGGAAMAAGLAGRMLGVTALVAAAGLAGMGGLAPAAAALLPRGTTSGMGGAGKAGGHGAAGSAGPGPLASFLRERLARLALLTRVSTLLGWRQASYLRKMVRQFEDGDLHEALRHAIPLDRPSTGEHAALGVPGRRHALDITGPNAGAGAIGMTQELIQYLRETYQRSFERLDQAGRIDEAVFVLAELMHRHQEAVDYLERKGRPAQAAQLAETLALLPALIVRLHCMAGNATRAVQVARLHGGFAEAVAELERRRHAAAPGLRLEWAQDLAARGDLAEAALAVWPLQDERGRALAWLQAAAQAGGVLGVQGLVYQLALDPGLLRTSAAAIRDLLHGQDEEAGRQRLRACNCLLKLDTHNPATRRLAAELWRRLLADQAAGRPGVPSAQLNQLLALAADPVLAEDVPNSGPPPCPAPVPLAQRSAPLQLSFGERGLLAIEDVRRLPDGGWLLALGEAGIALARADGSEVLRFPLPAHQLVLAHNGRHALALARREGALRVSRIDLLQRNAADWFSAKLDFWAHDYDGAGWSVVADERLMVLDTAAAGQSVLWQVRDLPGPIVGFRRQDGREALLMTVDGMLEQWRYALPQRRLLGRERCSVDPSVAAALPDCARDLPVTLRFLDEDAGKSTAVLGVRIHAQQEGLIELRWNGQRPRVSIHGDLPLLRFEREDGTHCQLLARDCTLLADVVLPDAVEARATVQDGHLLAWDRRGRVLEVDIATGAVRMVTFG